MKETRTKVAEYQLLDHGINGSQYFPGCGTSFTKYEHVVTGCGDNPREALEDALEQVAEMDFDAEALEAEILADENEGKPFPDKPSASDEFAKHNPAEEGEEVDFDGCELYYYLSIRWN